jgi:hypothetical protein
MSLTAEMLTTWRDPAAPVRRRLTDGVREDRALALVLGAGFLMFLARAPALARAAALDPSVPLDARLGITFFTMLFVLPLIAYGLAALLHIALRACGATGSAHGARLALFWALFAAAPAMLVQGLAEGLLGPTPAVRLFGLGVFAAFLWFLARGLGAAYRRPS